jgi:maltose/moltooligosaccharide transporter
MTHNSTNSSISSDKPRLNFWQIWNVSFGFLGVQFGFALQNANASRILSDFWWHRLDMGASSSAVLFT